MNKTRSYLESMNAGRRRRPSTSLEQLSQTLDELEDRIRRPYNDREAPAPFDTPRDHGGYHYARESRAPERDRRTERLLREEAQPRQRRESEESLTALSDELRELRRELRNQMGGGLQREFSTLKRDIEHALGSSAHLNQANQVGAELERLSSMIEKLAGRGDERQLHLLRQEMEEVKSVVGSLAREETLQSLDQRWEELDRRWSDIAEQTARSQMHQERIDPALADLAERIERINDAIGALPTSGALRGLENEVANVAAAMERVVGDQGRIGPEMLDAIGERLDEISRAVAASAASSRPATIDPEPFERIEARIAALGKLIGEAADTNAMDDLSDQLASIATRVDDLARRVDVPERTIDRLASQIASIAERVDSKPHDYDLSSAFAGVESRLSELSLLLEQRHDDALAQGKALFRDLERRVNDVALTLNSADAESSPAANTFVEALDARFAQLAESLDRIPRADAGDAVLRNLDQRIASLAERIDKSQHGSTVDPDLIRSLESQVSALASQLSATPPPSDMAAGNLDTRLEKIETALSSTRHDVVEAAMHAAQEAVRRFAGDAAERDVATGLVDDLKALEALARKSDDRNSRTFEAIHDTLLKIVDRLGALESDRPAPAPRTWSAAPSDSGMNLAEAPSLEPDLEAEPLEVKLDTPPAPNGIGGQKRSPAAAAAEAAAEAVREDVAAGNLDETGASSRKSLLSGLSRVLPGRKQKIDAQPASPPSRPVDVQVPEPSLDLDEPLDPAFANKPLEPGSGAPDLTAIMRRVRDERGQPGRGHEADAAKSDFIAAARRAAQAAAAEAEMMKRNPAAGKKAAGIGLGGILKSRRKPVLMGIAAVLMALAALQAGRTFLSSGEKMAQASDPAPIVAEIAKEEPEADEQPASEMTAREVTAPPVRVAEEASAPAETARSAMTDVPETSAELSSDWLETAAISDTTANEPAEAASPTETLPETDQDALSAIPPEVGTIALREAAATGDPKAFLEIGNRYADGRGVAENMAEAAVWYAKAADAGLAPAQYRIGNLYEKGVGVERDVAKAKTWYQLAAAQGNASAMHNLAVLFAMGADGTTDNESAARWFQNAAELGVKDSQFNLGILSAKGVGMPQNLEESYKWFAIVAKSGDKDAASKRDEIANALRPEQLEKARAAAELWRAKPIDEDANSVEIPDSWSVGQDTTASVDLKQAVKDIQAILNKNGYDAGAADGLMGRRTQSAIAAFQADNDMPATGEVDEKLVRALLALQ